MRVAVYLRQSEDRSGEEWGIDRQREDVLRLVKARGWTVAGEFIDNDVSATKRKPRPSFNAMMERVEAGEVDVVCAKHTDRLLRRVAELETMLERCATHGAYIVTTSEGVDTSTEAGRLVARILASVAQGEVERKAARQRAANKQAAQQGRWIGGRRPFGYTDDAMSLNPKEAALIRSAYSAILDGRSLYSIAAEWNSGGITTTLGNRWTGATVSQMLVKPRYAGIRTYHGVEEADGQWEPIVDRELWNTAVSILTYPGRQIAPTARKHLLSGILLCGKCEKPVGSSFNLHPIYKCKHCGGVSRRMEPVDALVEKLLLGFMASPQAGELLIDRTNVDVAALRERERILERGLDELAIERAEELLTARQVKIASDRLQKQLDEIRESLGKYFRSKEVEELVCEDPKPVWKGFTLDRRRRAIQEVVELRLMPGGKGSRFNREQLRYRWLVAED